MSTTLVTTQQLSTQLDNPDWVIIDCRFNLMQPAEGYAMYLQGHIPGAHYANVDKDLASPKTPTSGRHPLPDIRTLVNKLEGWGINNHSQVVAYDHCGGALAVRLWWLLRWLGHNKVALLDGGLPLWRQQGYAVTTALSTPPTRPRQFTAQVDASAWVETASIEKLQETGEILIDARTTERFQGIQEPIDPVAGHIPGAINVPFSGNLRAEGTFRTAHELQQRFAHYAAEKVIHMCGSGVTACHNILAMEIAGLPGSRLYVGSWSEWITDNKRAIAVGV